MIVMPSNNSSMHLGWLAGTYPSRIGWLLGPSGWRTPHHWLPYGCDNDRFAAAVKGTQWDEVGYEAMLANAVAMAKIGRAPKWILVPDIPFDAEATLVEWKKWAPRLAEFGWPLAVAVQDGMTQRDVPSDAAVIFVGGSTEWKWKTVWNWCANNKRVHVGRVNGYRTLWHCHDAGAESCDGTGWFRGDQEQLAGLERYLRESTQGGRAQARLVS
jgi:hypothetical protein